MAELMDQTKRLLQAYRLYHLNIAEMTDVEDREAKELMASRARDTFRAMFRGLLTDEAFLLGSSEQDVLQTLNFWLDTARPQSSGRTVGLTLSACSDILAHLSSDFASESGPAAWPFIRKIKYVTNRFVPDSKA